VRNLGRELVARGDVELVPVCWSEKLQAVVHAEQKLLDNLSRHGGPELEESSLALQAIAPDEGDWLLVAEVPHLQSYYPDYRPVLIDGLIGYARHTGLKVAVVLYDLLPLTHPEGGDGVRLFSDMLLAGADAGESQRMRFTSYAHALALADLVLPISHTSEELLSEWLVQHGHRAELLPPIAPVVLPEEIFGTSRIVPHLEPEIEGGPIEFLAVGSICAHKNQMRAMAAFQHLSERRPNLDLQLNLVGWVAADLAVPASLIARRAKGRIVLHGRLPDRQVRDLANRARATVFVSLAEGYGLPVAESLWYGKPCLCSGTGSIAEIARGGGCLTVNPHSISEIEAGFETLATDSARYGELLQQIAARRLKTWKQYAAEITDALVAVSSRRPLPVSGPESSVDASASIPVYDTDSGAAENGGAGASPRDAILVLSASDLNIHEAYDAKAGRPRSIYYRSAIHFDQERDGSVKEDVLFFGPYVPLPAGQYQFRFDGEIDGEIRLSFTAYDGKMRIGETALSGFDTPVPLDLPEAVQRFEIVGNKTPSLRHLTLRGAFAELRRNSPEVSRASASAPQGISNFAASGSPPAKAPAYVVDDDGRELRLPFAFPAARMRVHDAFGAGAANRLRANSAISFNRGAHADVAEAVLFFGPYLHLEPGRYSFRLNCALEGSLKLRFTTNFTSKCLRELVVAGFETPVQVDVEKPADKFEIIGERTEDTRMMRLESIEIAAAPLATGRTPDTSGEGNRGVRLFERAAKILRVR
jgi:glycosyltransferase involved in cell wall biosynthesis